MVGQLSKVLGVLVHVLADASRSASRSASHSGVDLSVKYDSRDVYKTHEMSAVTHVIG